MRLLRRDWILLIRNVVLFKINRRSKIIERVKLFGFDVIDSFIFDIDLILECIDFIDDFMILLD